MKRIRLPVLSIYWNALNFLLLHAVVAAVSSKVLKSELEERREGKGVLQYICKL